MSRIIDWIERDNARSGAVLAGRSMRWLVLRALLGVAFVVKGVSLMLHAPSELPYVLGPLAIVAGVAFAFESVAAMFTRDRRVPASIEHE